MRGCILHNMLEPLSMSTLCVSFCEITDTIFRLEVRYVCYICSAL